MSRVKCFGHVTRASAASVRHAAEQPSPPPPPTLHRRARQPTTVDTLPGQTRDRKCRCRRAAARRPRVHVRPSYYYTATRRRALCEIIAIMHTSLSIHNILYYYSHNIVKHAGPTIMTYRVTNQLIPRPQNSRLVCDQEN